MDNEISIYERLGGEQGLRRIVESFYRHMDTLPEVRGIRQMHPENLQASIDKLFMFLSGWTGGPQLFVERFGHPMLRKRHLPFAIGKPERDQWMICMVLALEEAGVEDELREMLIDAFLRLADHMRNVDYGQG
jgi:hemoglobin